MKSETPIKIYALLDPRTPGLVCYVGQSINPTFRLKEHMDGSDTGRKKKAWLRELANVNLKPQIVILETVPASRSRESEQAWMNFYSAIGMPLTNGKVAAHNTYYR